MNHRISPVIYTSYAVTDPKERWASGRAEGTRSFSHKNSQREFLCEKEKRSTMLPQANQASTWSNIQFEHPPRKSCHLLCVPPYP
jgi:hypothetical protein